MAALLLAIGCGTSSAQGIAREETGGHGGSGEPATGGATGGRPACETPLTERIASRDLVLAAPVIKSDEYKPVVVAPTLDGGALLGWREDGQNAIHVTRMDANDEVAAELPALDGMEIHAILAHEQGGAMLVVDDDPEIYSPKYCISEATPSNAGYCAKVDLVRFDDAGTVLWRSTLTNKQNVDSEGARFVWWYQHTARLLFAEDTYASYFRVAGSTARPGVTGEVDIHAGDALFFADSSGAPLAGGWDWGCSHSWSVRLAHNGRWGAACHGDPYPAGLQLAVLSTGGPPAKALLHEGVPPEQRALGGLVAMSGSFWLSHVAPDPGGVLELHLARIGDTGEVLSDRAIAEATRLDPAYPFRAYLAEYGGSQLLVGWKSGGKLQLLVLDRETGDSLEGPVETEAPIDAFEELVSLSNGDVVWAHSTGDGGVTYTRVRGC